MADKKISELNTATTVYDADDLAIVQDGETKQANASTVKAYVKDGLSKSDVGLGNVDNTSDANKPVSTATQTALNGKENADATILKSAAIGVSVQAYDADLTAWAGKTAPTGDAVGTSDSQTLTNKTISGATNTISNIGNSSLTNSSITINGNAVSLGGSTTVSATTNTLTIGTGLSGTSFNGSAATTIAIDSSVVTLTGTQTLTNKTLTSPTINGGTVNNVAIGGTTPAAGNFTTLGATGNTTLGDASGDTLTINGTAVSAPNGLNVNSNQLVLSGGNVGIGTSSPSYKLDVSKGSAGTAARFTASTDNGRGLSLASSDNGIYLGAIWTRDVASASGIHAWSINSSEKMRIDSSGNVGIGTSSPTYKAVVSGSSSNSVLAIHSATNTSPSAKLYLMRGTTNTFGGDSYTDWSVETSGADLTINSATSSVTSERLRIDSSGNLGLGVTPSAWSTGGNLDLLSAASIVTQGVNFQLGANWYYNGGYKYKTSSYATSFDQQNGQFKWFTAPSGTAGAAIAFTQAMTLDASGNLLVGTTSSSLTAGNGIKLNADNRLSVVNNGSAEGFIYYNSAVSAYRFYVSPNGTISATSTTITAISDQRLKENIQDLDVGLSSILALKPRKFDWKVGKGKDIKGDRGFIAQEFEQVFPDLIDVWKDEPPEGEEPYKAVRADLIPVLVKAIQELHAEIELLKAKVN